MLQRPTESTPYPKPGAAMANTRCSPETQLSATVLTEDFNSWAAWHYHAPGMPGSYSPCGLRAPAEPQAAASPSSRQQRASATAKAKQPLLERVLPATPLLADACRQQRSLVWSWGHS